MYYYLSIGSNVHPQKNSVAMIKLLLQAFDCGFLFPFIKTTPVGMVSDNSFLNSILVVDTDKDREQVKSITNEIEVKLGRDKSDAMSSVKDRCADIDILQISQHFNIDVLKMFRETYVVNVLSPSKEDIIDLSAYGLPVIDRPASVNLDRRTGNISIIQNKSHGFAD